MKLRINDNLSLENHLETFRFEANGRLNKKRQSDFGQFFTPTSVADFMASLFTNLDEGVSILDPGSGVGVLSNALIIRILELHNPPKQITLEVCEIDDFLINKLEKVIESLGIRCKEKGIGFNYEIKNKDFIDYGGELLFDSKNLFRKVIPYYQQCIMNPPYKKIPSQSLQKKILNSLGIYVTNLYSAFVILGLRLLDTGGELVAIIPRSFCNGVYFKNFRKELLSESSLKQIHIYKSRDEIFTSDDVLQENIIIHCVKGRNQEEVLITSSTNADNSDLTETLLGYSEIVNSNDPNLIIHIPSSDFDIKISERARVFNCSLKELGIDVSTGPIVDFRYKELIEVGTKQGYIPLIYSSNFIKNFVKWPIKNLNKTFSILNSKEIKNQTMPLGWYVITKRFSSNEEPKRIVAALFNPQDFTDNQIGFENHLNIFHQNKKGLNEKLAKGLTIFLNSTIVDLFFRQFSGHTQVNASDLRSIGYPNIEILQRWGNEIKEEIPDQKDIDRMIEEEINKMTNNGKGSNPIIIKRKIEETLTLLTDLGLPKSQQNDRSALTLLALLDIKPEDDWDKAKNPLIGITPIMEYVKKHYQKSYAPNTRETIRRQTMHQFVQAGLVVENPDDSERPTNSPYWCYQIESETFELIKKYRTYQWDQELTRFLLKHIKLDDQYKKVRHTRKIPLLINDGIEISLSSGIHSELISQIIEQFGPIFAPGSRVIYIGDTGNKLGFFDEEVCNKLNLFFDKHGKFPDVILYSNEKNWLYIIESVTSHGPMNPKRHKELIELFKDCTAKQVYVTAFPNKHIMGRFLSEISWETEVWLADSPSHLIHFNGDRFLGPYGE